MKILMLTDRLGLGGAETHVAELALGLRRMGMEVETLSEGGVTADALEREGIVCHRMPLCTHSPIRLFCLRRRIKALIRRGNYDVLHAHARIPAFLLRGMHGKGVSRIVTVHARFHSNRILRRLCYWGDRTVAVSEDLRRYVCDTYGVTGEAVCVIPNGVDCNRFFPVEERNDEALRILFASRLDHDCARGAELLCRIAPVLCRSYRNLEITIAGGGEALAEIRKLCDAVNRAVGRNCVVACGAVEDMAALLRQQDIFVGVSRAAMEAAACGCAVVLCGDEGYLGLLNRESSESAVLSNFCCRGYPAAHHFRLETDLRFLIEHAELRRRYAEEGRAFVLSSLSAEEMCRRTEALYRRAQRHPCGYRMLAGGYFGCGNAGDDAMLLGFLEELHCIAPRIHVQALTGDPTRDEARFGIRCINRKNPIAIRYVLRHADAFVCGGGSLLQNLTSRRSLRYYLSLLASAKRAGCRVVLYAAGIGPITGERDRERVVRMLNRCDYISLRDPDSLRFLSELGVEASLLHQGSDPALLMPMPPRERCAAILHEHGMTRAEEVLCVVLKRTPRYLAHSVVTAVRVVCQERGLRVLLLRFCEEDAATVADAERILQTEAIEVRSVEDLSALLRGSALVLSMRLHALVLAASHATVALGIVTDPSDRKILSFVKQAGQDAIIYPKPSVAELVARIDACLSKGNAQKRSVTLSAVEEMQKNARKDLANIVEMLYNREDRSDTEEPSVSS